MIFRFDDSLVYGLIRVFEIEVALRLVFGFSVIEREIPFQFELYRITGA